MTLRTAIAAAGLALGLAAATATPAIAAGGETPPLANVPFSFKGPFGMYDRAAVQRGFQVYREVCAACHGVKYLAFRNLIDAGFPEEQARAIAAEYIVVDGPDDFGEMYERPGRLSDRIPSPFPNAEAAKAANNGAYPVDLSLITKARANGPAYLYSLLTGYEDAPHDVEVGEGLYYNPYFSGGQISMAPPLADDLVEYLDGTSATLDQMTYDVVTFLTWAAEPHMEQRKQMGLGVLIFLGVFTVLLYRSNRKIWKSVKQAQSPDT